MSGLVFVLCVARFTHAQIQIAHCTVCPEQRMVALTQFARVANELFQSALSIAENLLANRKCIRPIFKLSLYTEHHCVEGLECERRKPLGVVAGFFCFFAANAFLFSVFLALRLCDAPLRKLLLNGFGVLWASINVLCHALLREID